MSFSFNWPRFSDQFHHDAIQMLNNALNKGNKPPVIADKIEVVELNMGTQPPDLEIRDIGDLAMDHFRGIFRMTYAGDAHLVLKTKVQANPLNHKQPDIHLMTGSQGMLAAKQPLVVPMLLRLSHFKLSSYVVLVISKQKGITLVFKTDPLQHVDINSTFDSIAVIQKFIQREIEGQLRQMFREDLPGIIHRLSQQWVKAKVEAPYLTKRPPGLADLAEEPADEEEEEYDYDEVTSFDMPPFSFSPGTSPPNDSSSSPGNSKIVVRPSLMNNSIRHLSTLSHSNHTLSPYTRSLAHFTVRSVPPRQIAHSYSFEKQPVKAKRKRTYRLGGAKQQQQASKPESTAPSERDSDVHPYHPSSSPPPSSEFDAGDMDLYFRHRDDMSTHHVRKRYPPLAIPQRHPRI
ncbi:Mitochondrial distribution and morphology protein 34 [Amanita muscaria]